LSDAGEELAMGIAAADCWQLGYDGVEDCVGVGVVFVGEGRNAYAWLAA